MFPLYGPGGATQLKGQLRVPPAPIAPAGVLGAIANNTILPASLITTGQIEQSTIHTVRRSGSASDFRLVFPRAWYGGPNKALAPLPSSYTVQACAVRPIGGSWSSVTRSGAASWTVTPWDGTEADTTIDLTDSTVAGFTPANNTDYELFIYATGANLPAFNAGNMASMHTDEGLNTSATANGTPKTITVSTDTSRKTRFAICGIVGTTSDRTAFIWGDSQEAWSSGVGPTEGEFADHNRGMIASTIGATMGHINGSVGGDQVETALFTSKMRRELMAYCTDVIYAQGINSWNNKSNLNANVDGLMARLMPVFNGKRVTGVTTTPRTTGVWTLADGTDQTLASYAASLVTYNAALAGYGMAGPLDKFALVKHPTIANKWNADGTVKKYTGDGLHPTRFVVQSVLDATTRTNWLATIAAAPIVTGKTQPAVTFVATSGTIGFGTVGGSGAFLNSTSTQALNTVVPGTFCGFVECKVKLSAAPAADFTFMANSTARFIKKVLFKTTGAVEVTSNSGAIFTTTGVNLGDGLEHTLRWTSDGTSLYFQVDGGAAATLAGGNINVLAPNFDFSTKAATPVVGVRDLVVCRLPPADMIAIGAGTYTGPATYTAPVTWTGGEAECVAYFAFASSATGIKGPVLTVLG